MNDMKEMGNVTEVKGEDKVLGTAVFTATAKYDSGWISDNNNTNHNVVVNHNLKAIPTKLEVVFSTDQQTVYPLNWSWYWDCTGNPVTISMTNSTITMAIFSGAPLHGVWTSDSKWKKYSTGYWRIFAS